MCGEMTDKETIGRVDECLEQYMQDQFEILLYKKNRKSITYFAVEQVFEWRLRGPYSSLPNLQLTRGLTFLMLK